MITVLGVLCGLLVVALFLVVRGFLSDVREREDAFSLERIGWVEERRELLNRIQRPEYVPTGPVVHFEVPEAEPDDVDKVGTIEFLDEAIS